MFINSHPSPPLFHIHHMPTWTCPRRPGLRFFRCPDRFSPRCQPLPGGDSPCLPPAPPSPQFSEGKSSPLSSWTPFPQTPAQTILTKTHTSYHLSRSPGFSPPPSLSSRSPPGTPATPAMTPERPLGPELPPQPASLWSTMRVSMSLPEAKDTTPSALAGTGSHPRGPNTPRMPLGSLTVPGAAPARPALWAGEEGLCPGGAGGHLRVCAPPPPRQSHTHRQPGPKSWCPSAPAPACSHLWDSHQPGLTGLGPEAAPGTCRTSASGGTALRRPLPALSPRLHTGGWSPRARPRSLLSGAPRQTQDGSFHDSLVAPQGHAPQVQVKVERSVERTMTLRRKACREGLTSKAGTAGHSLQVRHREAGVRAGLPGLLLPQGRVATQGTGVLPCSQGRSSCHGWTHTWTGQP